MAEGIKGDKYSEMMELREKLVREASKFRKLITELTDKYTETIYEFGKPRSVDIWAMGLGQDFDYRTAETLSSCIDTTNSAIGKLQDDVEEGIRDEQGNLIEKPQIFGSEPPKVFISHGREGVALSKLKEFIETLGIESLIVKKQASIDKNLPDKVDLYLSQADFVIILATGDDNVTDKITGRETKQPRQNVIHEIGLAQKTHPGRIIYLLEEGVEFPSNIKPKVWESFKPRNMMDALLGILRELQAYGMLNIIKTPPK